LNIAQSSGPLD